MFLDDLLNGGRKQVSAPFFDIVDFVRDWGFRPEDVTQPVTLFLGDADGILSPQMYRDLSRRLPRCEAREWGGGGHYALFARARWAELLAACGDQDPPD